MTSAQASAGRREGLVGKRRRGRPALPGRHFPGVHGPLQKISKISNYLQIFGGLVLGCIKNAVKSFDSIFQVLQDLHSFAPLQSQNFRKKSV